MELEQILAVVSSSTALGLGLLYIREKARRKKEEILGYRDFLTGLHNRRYFYEQAPLALKEAERYNEEAALLFVDVDNFKHINDSIGHQFGDEVLRALAVSLKECVRETDIAARYGGDEFLAYLKRSDGNSIMVKERIQEIFKSNVRSLFKNPEYRNQAHFITELPSASIGIATAKETNYSLTDMIKLAESRMYQTKRTSGHSKN